MPLEFPGTLLFCFMVSTSFVLPGVVQRVSHTDILEWISYHKLHQSQGNTVKGSLENLPHTWLDIP